MNAKTDQQPRRGSAGGVNAAVAEFVRALSVDVSGPPLELPSFPEVALRLQRALTDTEMDAARVVSVLGGDAVLAARVLSLANSAALNRSGKAIVDLKLAVSRVGFDTLRTAAVSFALAQLRKASEYRSVEKQLTALWQESVGTAAMSFILSRKLKLLSADSAMLAGLVSGVGKLYLLTRSGKFPELFADAATYDEIERDWHPAVAKSILENWHMPVEIVDAVAALRDASIDPTHDVQLADLLSISMLLHSLGGSPDLLAASLVDNHCARRVGVTAEFCTVFLAQSSADVNALRDALGR
jgi:HD-like signal output (HDOD) protein